MAGEATRLSSLRWMRSCGPQLFHILALNTELPVLAGLLEDLGGGARGVKSSLALDQLNVR